MAPGDTQGAGSSVDSTTTSSRASAIHDAEDDEFVLLTDEEANDVRPPSVRGLR